MLVDIYIYNLFKNYIDINLFNFNLLEKIVNQYFKLINNLNYLSLNP